MLFEDGFQGGSWLSRGVVRDVVAELAVVGHGNPPRRVAADVVWIALCLGDSLLVGRLSGRAGSLCELIG